MDAPTAYEYCDSLLRHFSDKLSEWEDGFVRSVRSQAFANTLPTEKQAAVLDRLMDRVAKGCGK